MLTLAVSYPGSDHGLFFSVCNDIGERREAESRRYWTIDDWHAWVAAGRAAFGKSQRALFGQLTLVEALLNSGCTSEQITAEVCERKETVERQDQKAKEQARRASESTNSRPGGRRGPVAAL